MSCAGRYNGRAFQALDYILDEASKVGVRLILTMTDNWSPADSKVQVAVLSHHFLLIRKNLQPRQPRTGADCHA